MSTFDLQSFVNGTTEQVSERRDPLPITRDYQGLIGEVKAVQWSSDKGGEFRSGVRLEFPVKIVVPPDLQPGVGTDELTIKEGIMLDLTPSNTIDYGKGKNGRLRMYREATRQNSPGASFAPAMLQGRLVTVKLRHEEYPEGSGQLMEKIAAVAVA